MPNRRSPKKLEEKLARQYVYKNSKSCTGKNSLEEEWQRVFTGKEEDLTQQVLVDMQGKQREGNIPDLPQGLVIYDAKGEGYFDINF